MKLLLPIRKVKVKLEGYLSLPKLTNLLSVLILLFSSTQLGFHFWPSSAFVYGVRVDYLSPTLYFLDLLILLYLFLTGLIHFLNQASHPARFWRTVMSQIVAGLAPLLLVNLLFSLNPLASLSWSLHFLLYLAFIFSLSLSQLKTLLVKLLPFILFFQVALGFLQTWLGHTIQGPFYWLGERALSVGSPNVAKSELLGSLTLRAYSTFSHPNILAGWLIIACLIGLALTKNLKYKIFNITLVTLGLLITQSRAAALAFFGFIVPFSLLKSLRLRLLYYLVFTLSLIFLLNLHPLSPSDLSISERLNLQRVSLSIFHTYPLFGTGASASLSAYPSISSAFRLLQPDHDSFTLLLSWFGLAGVLALLSLTRFPIIHNSKFILHTIPLLPLLLFDHYLLTSPQGLFILLLYFRVSGSLTNRPTDKPIR